MVNYYIYAKDFSGSTSHVSYYHENGLKTLKQFKSDVIKIQSEISEDAAESRVIYLHWGHECEQVDENKTIDCYKKKFANGDDTLPETIIRWIKTNINSDDKIKLLYIITDGLIGSQSLNTCLKLNENVNYENVIFHGIHRNYDYIDLSVAASFLKCKCTIYRNNELLDNTDISVDFDYDKITIENFNSEKEKLKSYIKLKYINSAKNSATALAEIDKLKQLRNRLFGDLSSGNNNIIETNNKDTFLREFKNTIWYKNLFSTSNDLKVNIEKIVSTLINHIISEKKSYAFDALKFETKFSNEVAEEPIVDVNFSIDQEIEFPDIILNDDKGIPVVLCTELNLLDKLIFHSSSESVSPASFSKFKAVMDCPLFLLNDPEFNDTIGYFYTLNVYKQLLQQPTKTEPRTRRPYHGGLVLLDTEEFDAYNDYILSATYFNFKKVKYNFGLFYYTLWKICEQKQWMDKNVVEQFKKYTIRRVSSTVCNIGLSSLPLDPQIQTSLPTALWYCVEMSTYIFKDDPVNFAQERLRMYYGVAHCMIEILKWFQYELNLEYINKRKNLIRYVMILKKIPKRRDKIYYLAEKVFKTVNGFFICEIVHPENVKLFNYLDLNHKGMLSDNEITKAKEVNLNNYVHFMYNFEDCGEVQICPETFRPFFMIDENKSYYSKIFDKCKKPNIKVVNEKIIIEFDPIVKLDFSKIVSVYKLFLNCVKDNNKYPTLNEYVDYILKKKKFKDDLVAVFAENDIRYINIVFHKYATITKDVSVTDFIRVSDMYVNRVERIKAERKHRFKDDNEILKFIREEENKDNAKRKI